MSDDDVQMAVSGHHALVDGQLGELGAGLERHAGGDHEDGGGHQHARVLEEQSPQAQATPLLGALVLREVDVGLAVVGLLGQELVHAVLELGGDAAEGQPGRGRRAGAPAPAEHGPSASPPAEAHQLPPCPAADPFPWADARRPERDLGVGIDLGQDFGVLRGRGQQLGVGAVGHDVPVLEQDDAVGQADRREPVRHDQRGATLHEHAQRVVDLLLDLDVDGAGGVVEHQDGRVDEQGAGDGDALALTARQGVAAFAHHRVVAVGQFPDEGVGPGGPGGGLHVGDVGVGAPVGDVVPDRHREQEGVVEHDTDVGAQALDRQVPHVVAVHQERRPR